MYPSLFRTLHRETRTEREIEMIEGLQTSLPKGSQKVKTVINSCLFHSSPPSHSYSHFVQRNSLILQIFLARSAFGILVMLQTISMRIPLISHSVFLVHACCYSTSILFLLTYTLVTVMYHMPNDLVGYVMHKLGMPWHKNIFCS